MTAVEGVPAIQADGTADAPERRTYRFAGLVLRSGVLLPELHGSEAEQAEVEVLLSPTGGEFGGLPDTAHHWRRPDGSVSLSCARCADDYILVMPDGARFEITGDGARVTCSVPTPFPRETLAHNLIDQVLPRVAALRGRLVLHAAGVALPHGAIALLGDSGAGKSTLSAAFVRAGALLLGDDGLILRDAPGGGVEALPTYPGLRLLPEALHRTFGQGAATLPMAHDSAKRRVAGDARLAFVDVPVRVARFYVLSGPDEGARGISIEPLSRRDSFMALLRSCFHLHLGDPVRTRAIFERLGPVADAVPVRRIGFPRDLGRLDEVRDAMARDSEKAAVRV